MIVSKSNYADIQIMVHQIEGNLFCTVWRTNPQRVPTGQITQDNWTPEIQKLVNQTINSYKDQIS